MVLQHLKQGDWLGLGKGVRSGRWSLLACVWMMPVKQKARMLMCSGIDVHGIAHAESIRQALGWSLGSGKDSSFILQGLRKESNFGFLGWFSFAFNRLVRSQPSTSVAKLWPSHVWPSDSWFKGCGSEQHLNLCRPRKRSQYKDYGSKASCAGCRGRGADTELLVKTWTLAIGL